MNHGLQMQKFTHIMFSGYVTAIFIYRSYTNGKLNNLLASSKQICKIIVYLFVGV